uniref:Uncharacterized protein n=1 Tax=Plectus sambesii TaxID=2011161 RepID=A0A914WQZ7_9BILA
MAYLDRERANTAGRANRQIDSIYTPGYARNANAQGHELVPIYSGPMYFPGEQRLNYDTSNKLRGGGNLPRFTYDNGGPGLPGMFPAPDGAPPIKPHTLRPEATIVEPDMTEVLFYIPSLGQHRFLYSLNKFPGIITMLLSAWLLWGRGQIGQTWYEEALGITGFVLSLWILLGWLYGLQNHHNVYQRARSYTTVRIVMLCGNIIITLIMLVFAILAIVDLQNDIDNGTNQISTTTPSGTTTAYDMTPPYTKSERVTIASVLLGMTIMIMLFSLVSIVYGAYGLSRLHKFERNLRRHARAHYAYDNRTATF